MKEIKRLTVEEIRNADGKKTAGIMEIEGRRLYVETYGHMGNPAIAFLHGGPGTSCVEQEEMAVLLSERYFVVSFDQYGVFRSGDIGKEEHFGMKEHIAQMEALRRELGLESWTLLGHSYGGMLVCYYTYHYPESIDASIYENPGWFFVENAKGIAQYYLDEYYSSHPEETEGLAEAKAILEKDYTGREGESVTDILKAQSFVKEKRVTMYMYSIQPEDYFHVFDECFRELDVDENWVDEKMLFHTMKLMEAGEMLEDHRPKLDANQQPALLLVGKYDPVCREKDRKYFREHAPQGKVVVMENSAHHPRLEDKETYLQAVFDFMDEIGLKKKI